MATSTSWPERTGGHSVEADPEGREVYLFINQGDNETWEPILWEKDGLYNGLLHDRP